MTLVSLKKVTAAVADIAKIQYTDFVDHVVKENESSFLAFDKVSDRLDSFLFSYVLSTKFCDLAEMFKILLILSHGQSPSRKRVHS